MWVETNERTRPKRCVQRPGSEARRLRQQTWGLAAQAHIACDVKAQRAGRSHKAAALRAAAGL